MSSRLLLSLVGSVTAIFAASVMVTAQRAAAPPLVVTAYNGGPPIPYTVPRTPWGDPDLLRSQRSTACSPSDDQTRGKGVQAHEQTNALDRSCRARARGRM
jgi:hypothetical protein